MPIAKLSENWVEPLLCSCLVCHIFFCSAFSIFLQEDSYILSWKSQHLRHIYYSCSVHTYPPISAPGAFIQNWYVHTCSSAHQWLVLIDLKYCRVGHLRCAWVICLDWFLLVVILCRFGKAAQRGAEYPFVCTSWKLGQYLSTQNTPKSVLNSQINKGFIPSELFPGKIIV